MAVSEIENALPKFNTWMMLVLGIIVGMISYLLFFYAKASPVPVSTSAVTAQYIGLTNAVPSNPGVGYTQTLTAWNPVAKTATASYTWLVYQNTKVTIGGYFKNTGPATTAVVRAIKTTSSVPASSCPISTTNQIGTDQTVSIPASSSVFVTFATPWDTLATDTGVAECVVKIGQNAVGASGDINAFAVAPSNKLVNTFCAGCVADPFGGTKDSLGNLNNPGNFGTANYDYAGETCNFTTSAGTWTGVNTGVTLTCSFKGKVALNLGRLIDSVNAAPAPRQCEDGIDNETKGNETPDGFIDSAGYTDQSTGVSYAPDPGCRVATDNQEKDPSNPVH